MKCSRSEKRPAYPGTSGSAWSSRATESPLRVRHGYIEKNEIGLEPTRRIHGEAAIVSPFE